MKKIAEMRVNATPPTATKHPHVKRAVVESGESTCSILIECSLTWNTMKTAIAAATSIATHTHTHTALI